MQTFPKTIVLRHRKENLKKCSLRGLETRDDIVFFTYPKDSLPDLTGYIQLDIDAPPLTNEDRAHGLFILDATWRYAATMKRQADPIPGILSRSLPGEWRTAYPRKQEDCPDPKRGLASIEAIFAAYHIMGRNTEGLLDHYHWKEDFLKKNAVLFLA